MSAGYNNNICCLLSIRCLHRPGMGVLTMHLWPHATRQSITVLEGNSSKVETEIGDLNANTSKA
jgi:hypothetical protein